ncbi:MAG: glycosyltransferase family 39 protein [Thermoguttaceae bacterium]
MSGPFGKESWRSDVWEDFIFALGRITDEQIPKPSQLMTRFQQNAVAGRPKSDRKAMDLASKGVTWLLLVFVFGFSVIRAKTQPIAHDEALTYVSYIAGGIGQTLKFSPNNHVLFTWAAALVTKLFGVSEFTLRLPTLAGMAAYLVSSYFLCRRLFGTGILSTLTCALLVTNPVVLDFLVAARGYGLGLAFLMLAAAIFADLSRPDSFRSHPDNWQWKCAIASACLGFSVTANLSYLVPTISLAVAFAVVTLSNLRTSGKSYATSFALIGRLLAVPSLTISLFILWPYLIEAKSSSYNFGYHKLSVFLREFVDSSLLYRWTDETYANLGARPLVGGSWQHLVSTGLSFVALPLLTLAIAVGFGVTLCKPRLLDRPSQRTWCCLFCGATIGCTCLLVLLHLIMLSDYPVIRGCLYLVPLYTVSGALIAREFGFRRTAALRLVGVCVSLVIATDYLASLQMSTFRYNVYDARSREAFMSISKDAERRGLQEVRLGGTWWYEPELNFYRLRYHANRIRTYEMNDPSAPFGAQGLLRPADNDYFCFTSENKPDGGNVNWRVIFHDYKTDITIVATER